MVAELEFRTILRGGDRRSLGRAAAALALLRQDPRRTMLVIPLLRDPDPVVAMRAADILEKLSRSHPASLQPFKRGLLSQLQQATQQEVQWHLAQLVPRLVLSPPERVHAFQALERYLSAASSIVRTSALQGLAELARGNARLRARARRQLLTARENGTPAMKARARHLLLTFSVPRSVV